MDADHPESGVLFARRFTLIQLLLPLADNEGNPFPGDVLHSIQTELSDRFGGLTAYSRAPAKGVWTGRGGNQEDDIVIVEVMTQTLDVRWWRQFRRHLEEILRQKISFSARKKLRSCDAAYQ